MGRLQWCSISSVFWKDRAGKGQNITTSEEPPDLIGKSLLNNTHLMVLTFRGINAHILRKFFYFCENCSAAKFVWKASNPIFQFGFGQLNWRGKFLIYISEYSILHFTVDIGLGVSLDISTSAQCLNLPWQGSQIQLAQPGPFPVSTFSSQSQSKRCQ